MYEPGEPWEDAEPWADLHFGTLSLLKPGPGNAEMTFYLLSLPSYSLSLSIKDLKDSEEKSDMILAFKVLGCIKNTPGQAE